MYTAEQRIYAMERTIRHLRGEINVAKARGDNKTIKDRLNQIRGFRGQIYNLKHS